MPRSKAFERMFSSTRKRMIKEHVPARFRSRYGGKIAQSKGIPLDKKK